MNGASSAGPEAPDAPEWPAHQRVAAAFLRASCFAVPGVLLLPEAGPALLSWLFALGLTLFLCERRDAEPREAVLRLLAGLSLGCLVAPFAAVWASGLGRGGPAGGYAAFGAAGRLLEDGVTGLVLMALPLTCLLGPLVLARGSGRGAQAQLEAVAVTAGGVGAGQLLLTGEPTVLVIVPLGLFLLLGAVAVVLHLGDALARRFGVAGPEPVDRPVDRLARRAAVAALILVAVPSSALWSKELDRLSSGRHRHGTEAAAIGALKTLDTSQTLYREGDKDLDEALDYAPDLWALRQTRLIDDVLGGGVKQGYLYRMTRPPEGHPGHDFLWAAVAEPVRPGSSGDRSFFTNQSGVIFYTLATEPLPLDALTCQPPGRLQPIGR